MHKRDLSDLLLSQIRRAGLPEPVREFRFHPVRRWRFDLCWPDAMLAVECEGAIWRQGRHTRGAGFVGDCEKYAEGNLLGWHIYRIPEPWITRTGGEKAIRLITRALRLVEEETRERCTDLD